MRRSLLLSWSLLLAAGTAAFADPQPAAAEGAWLEEIVVTALRAQPLRDVPASVTVLDADTLRVAGEQHFEDVVALVPNLNWAGGTSRPRYFQIRGIGELEQYEGAPNPSVGFLIDDIDFSGIGMPATLFDVDRIEVLRGPQGTRYGANALAGLISVRTAEPSQDAGMSLEASAGDYSTGSLGFVATSPVASLDSAWRLSVHKYRSDGFRTDPYLNRDSTNGRDELTAHFKWRWQPSPATLVDFALLHANLDNGYDAWSIDNSSTSASDRPGVDTQRATGGSLRLESSAWAPATLTVIGAYARSKSVNSFDGDWGNAALWAPYTYDFFARSDRDRGSASLELRLASPAAKSAGEVAWLVGAYGLHVDEDGRDTSVGVYADPFDPEFDLTVDDGLTSRYRATNAALFGQLDGRLTERLRWSAGLRGEERSARYRDAGIWEGAPRTTDLRSRDQMFGGQLSLGYDLSRAATVYLALSRGYKAGGFNLGRVPPDRLEFKPESLWNLELGMKRSWLDGRLASDTALFYSRRRDVQVRTSEQLDPSDPNSFVFFTSNASAGYNYGLESSLRWRIDDRWELGGSLGLLETRYLDFQSDGVALPDRAQAHAPQYQAALNASWHHPAGWMARVDFTAVDSFYFDVPPNDTRSKSYTLTNLKTGYESAHWSAYVWARNLFNESYALRGFFFGNEPPDFPDKLYIQRGDPRQWGVTFDYRF
jgi:outer membrane receptor protein involved in Fe transport